MEIQIILCLKDGNLEQLIYDLVKKRMKVRRFTQLQNKQRRQACCSVICKRLNIEIAEVNYVRLIPVKNINFTGAV
jgi:hypothetical protein